MNRTLILLLVLSICLFSLSPIVSASEVDAPEFAEVLDFCMPNGLTNTKVYEREDGTLRTTFSLTDAWSMDYFDLIFTIPEGTTCTDVLIGNSPSPSNATSLTVVNIADNMYRAYGHVEFQTRGFYIWVEGTAFWVTWYSVKVSTNALVGYDEQCTCLVMAYGFQDTINFNSSDIINHRTFTGANDPEANFLDLYIECVNWRKYDYLEFWLQADTNAIDGITVTQNYSSIPYTLTYIDNGATIENHFNFIVRLDLRDVDRTGPDIILHIEGVVNQGSENLIGVMGCRGHLSVSDIDKDVAWYRQFYYFLRDDLWFNLRSILENGFGIVGRIEDLLSPDANTEINTEISDKVQELDKGVNELNKLEKPDLNTALGNIDMSQTVVGVGAVNAILTATIENIYMGFIFLLVSMLGIISYLLYGRG